MNQARCETVRERIPDLVAGRLLAAEAAALEAHLAGCGECRSEAELIAGLFTARPAAPAGLSGRIEGTVRFRRRAVARPWWGLAAASVAAVALGIGVVSDSGAPPDEQVPAFVASVGETSPWLGDEGRVGGAPALDGLSEEALLTLLEEMESAPSGGAA